MLVLADCWKGSWNISGSEIVGPYFSQNKSEELRRRDGCVIGKETGL